MSNTSGHEPSGSPLGQQYRQWVLNMAQDIQELNRLKPLIEFGARDVVGGGGERLATFPAKVAGAVPGMPCGYFFQELINPWDPNSVKPTEDGGRLGYASNTLEVGLKCPSDPDFGEPIYIPPGITEDCLFNPDGSLLFRLNCRTIGYGGVAVVPMHELIAVEDMTIGTCAIKEGEGIYYFAVPIPFCIECAPDEGGGGEP